MRNRRVSQHALNVVLHNGHHVADRHRQHCHDCQRANPTLVRIAAGARGDRGDRKTK